jgi:hypothetical protein
MKLSEGINRFTIDLGVIASVQFGRYENKLIMPRIRIRDRNGSEIIYVEYQNDNEMMADYESVIKQWKDYCKPSEFFQKF